MTYILHQNFRDLLWPTFDVKYTLYMLDTLEYVQNGFKSDDQIWARSDLLSDRQTPMCKHAPYANNFDFDLAYDVVGDLEVNEIRLRSTVLAGLSNVVWILKIEPVVSEKGGGGALKSPQSVALWDIPQSGAG